MHQDPSKTFNAMQTIGDTSPLAGYGRLIILPYDNMKQFHNEYVVHSFSRGFAAQFIAGYTTFSTAFRQRENFRFLGAKGSFNTCEIFVVEVLILLIQRCNYHLCLDIMEVLKH